MLQKEKTNKYRIYVDEKVMDIPDYKKLAKHLKKDDKYRPSFLRDMAQFYNAKKILDMFVELKLVTVHGKDDVEAEHLALVERLRRDFPEIEKYIDKIVKTKKD